MNSWMQQETHALFKGTETYCHFCCNECVYQPWYPVRLYNYLIMVYNWNKTYIPTPWEAIYWLSFKVA